MKKIVFLFVTALLIMLSCTEKELKSPIEGAWETVFVRSRNMDETYPAQIQGEQIKMWSKEYFTFCGHFEWDTLSVDNYGWGTYTLDGNKYTESVKWHTSEGSRGSNIKMLMDIQNDTLIQKWPVDENWNLPENYSIEKYVRLK